jgi:APA family basic amino acid/polyamine antiporter
MGSGVQKLTSLLKALALLAFITVCFIYGKQGKESVPATSTVQSGLGLFAAISLSFQMVLGAYGGWNTAVYFTEEDKNPAKNIPRSLHLGVFLVVIIYLLVNLALLYVLPSSVLAASPLAAADAMNQIWGHVSSQVLTLIAIISILGGMNAVFLFLPRVLLALGRDGLFTSKATMVNKGGTPFIALAITTATALALVSLGTFETLMAIYTFFAVASNILLVSALFILRKREPLLPRPFKTWAYPYAPILLLLISIFLFVAYVISDTLNSLYAIAIVAISYPAYKLIKPNP